MSTLLSSPELPTFFFLMRRNLTNKTPTHFNFSNYINFTLRFAISWLIKDIRNELFSTNFWQRFLDKFSYNQIYTLLFFFFFSRRMRQRTRQTSVYNNSRSLTIRWRAAEVYFSSQICTGILPQTKSFDRGWFTKEAGCFEIKLFTEEIRCFHGMPRRNSFRLYFTSPSQLPVLSKN